MMIFLTEILSYKTIILAQNLTFITPTTFGDFAFFAPPPRLFQPPRL